MIKNSIVIQKNTYFYISNENQNIESLLEKAKVESKKKQLT